MQTDLQSEHNQVNIQQYHCQGAKLSASRSSRCRHDSRNHVQSTLFGHVGGIGENDVVLDGGDEGLQLGDDGEEGGVEHQDDVLCIVCDEFQVLW